MVAHVFRHIFGFVEQTTPDGATLEHPRLLHKLYARRPAHRVFDKLFEIATDGRPTSTRRHSLEIICASRKSLHLIPWLARPHITP